MMIKKVIEFAEGSKQSQEGHLNADSPDPAFFMSEVRMLRLEPALRTERTAGYLSHYVAREPRDLRAQIQRINLHLEQNDAERMYAALVDLFIVLNDKGTSLRKRMLTAAKRLLDEEKFEALATKIEVGLSTADPLSVSSDTMLSKGVMGTNRVIERAGSADKRERDVMEDVRSYIEFGQLEEARQALEDALLRTPWRLELHTELLEIYEVTRDRQSFEAMQDLLTLTGHPFPEPWKNLSEKMAASTT